MFVLCIVLQAITILLLAYVVFSWIPRPPEPLLPIARGLHRLFSPVLEPIRRVLPPLQLGGVGLDLSVLVLFLIIVIVESAVCAA